MLNFITKKIKERAYKKGHYKGYVAGRKSIEKEVNQIRDFARLEIEQVAYKVSEEVQESEGQIYKPKQYGLYYSFKPDYEAYQL